MKERVFATILYLLNVISTAAGQDAWQGIGEPIALTPPNQGFIQPIFSPDGTKIAVAGENYRGLWVMDADGQKLRQLSDEVGAGYRFEWSSDSKEILTRVSKYQGRRKAHLIKVFNVENSESRLIKEFKSSVYSQPKWSGDETSVFIVTKNGLESFASQKRVPRQQSAQQEMQREFYVSKNVFHVIGARGEELKSFKPIPGTYLNAVLSPNGQKIAFQVLGGNMYAVNMDGSGLIDLGPGERPRWSPDSDWLVYMITTDDGHQLLSSDIFVIRVDGTSKTNLTKTEELLEMNPCWSPDGKFIVFDEKKSGRIYLLRLKKE